MGVELTDKRKIQKNIGKLSQNKRKNYLSLSTKTPTRLQNKNLNKKNLYTTRKNRKNQQNSPENLSRKTPNLKIVNFFKIIGLADLLKTHIKRKINKTSNQKATK